MDLFPHFTFRDVTHINPKIFEGKKLLIFDIDNTLFFSETTEIRKDILTWFKKTKKKHLVVCFSNSFSIRARKSKIESILGCEIFLSKERKPSKKLFQTICHKYKVNPTEVVVVGDFHFTDVFFANRNHATSVLVRPFGGERNFFLWLARRLENFLLFLVSLFKSK